MNERLLLTAALLVDRAEQILLCSVSLGCLFSGDWKTALILAGFSMVMDDIRRLENAS